MAECIERAAAVTVCDKQYRECLRKSDFCGDTVAWNICADIKAIPAADVAPVVHGRWVKGEEGEWSCTNCRETVAICESGRERTYRKPYCPNCGALMDGGDGNEAD